MAKIDELKSLAADLRKRLKAVDQLTGRAAERDRDARRKREARAAAKEVQVPPCQDPARRARLEADDTEWLRYYFHELFWYPFTTQQLEMIEAIRNAIRYGGGSRVEIAVRNGDGDAELVVRDRGPGIDAAVMPHLFGFFENPARQRPGGLGLGLWIVQTLCVAMGGVVSVENCSDGGARFCVVLPRG